MCNRLQSLLRLLFAEVEGVQIPFAFDEVNLVRRFANDANTYSTRFWRIINEVPFVLVVFIVILVIVQPFG